MQVCMIDRRRYCHDAYLRRYADALADSGAKIDVLCLRDRDPSSAASKNGEPVLLVSRIKNSLSRVVLGDKELSIESVSRASPGH